jgi:hypothetical protein
MIVPASASDDRAGDAGRRAIRMPAAAAQPLPDVSWQTPQRV